MAILIPTFGSTFADSTKTEGGPLRKLVLAQFRSDADFAWVKQTRTALVKEDELKYRDFAPRRHALRSNKPLYESIEKGIAQATIVVIDPGQYEELVQDSIDAEAIERAGDREKALIDGCAFELIEGTPVAYLPEKVAEELNVDEPIDDARDEQRVTPPVVSLANFAPAEIQKRLGHGLNNAMAFAARAHATFDVTRLYIEGATQSIIRSSRMRRLVLPEVLATTRTFDKEHPVSVQLLNEAIDVIADGLAKYIPTVAREPLIKEVDSKALDELQACDVAAGWAREMLELGDIRNLCRTFRRVWKNGQRVFE